MIHLVRALIIINLSLCLLTSSGCAGSRIERDPADRKIIGQVAEFHRPMAYLILSKKDSERFHDEAVKIGRMIVDRKDIEDRFGLYREYPGEYFKDGMIFTVVDVYWVRHGIVKREFAPALHMVILKDENGTLSVCSLSKIKNIETNIRGELQ